MFPSTLHYVFHTRVRHLTLHSKKAQGYGIHTRHINAHPDPSTTLNPMTVEGKKIRKRKGKERRIYPICAQKWLQMSPSTRIDNQASLNVCISICKLELMCKIAIMGARKINSLEA